LVRAVVRASAAAPHYFEPERLQIAEDVVGAFVDGGVSPYNNPAIQLLMLATLEGYGLKWPFGADKLLLVSVGTGYRDFRLKAEDVLEMPAVQLAAQSILSIMGDCDWLSQTILQWMSRSPMPWQIDSEIGDLQNDIPGTGQELISYLRYNVRIETAWIKQYLGLELPEEEVNGLIAMDQPKNVRQLGNLGTTAAAVQIKEDHFPTVFDIAPA
ncbi:MAG TPA: patatin, partial [Anaerolineae bacterium]